ncbi:MAG: tetratricopeptide repeat protein, partial [bacterium]
LAVDRRSTLLFLASGLVLGLSAVARPSILILIPVLPFVFHWSRRGGAVRRDRAWLRQTILVIAGSLVVIMPVIVRNYVIGRDIVPIASQGGVNFYIGNNPQSNGSLAMVPGARADMYGTYHGAIELAEADVGKKLKPSEVSNYYTKKALAFIAGSPLQAARLFGKKLHLFWAGQERSNNKYIQFFWNRFGLGKIPLPGFWLVGPLGLLGSVLLWRRRRRLSLLYLFVGAYMVGVVIFFVNGRFRLPVTPVLIIFAAYGVQHLIVSLRTRSADLLKGILILGVCTFIVDYDYVSFRGVRSLDEAISYYELGNAYLKLGNEDAALAEYEKAHAVQTRYPTRGYADIAGTIDYNIGAIYWQKGLYARAIEALERVPKNDPRANQAGGMLADCYLKRGRPEDAIRIYKSILAENPLDLRILFGLGIADRMTGNYAGSEEAFRRILELQPPSDGSVNLELARTLTAKGDIPGAEENYRRAAASPQQRRVADLELARLYRRTGERGKALEILSQLRQLYPNDREIEAELNAARSGR